MVKKIKVIIMNTFANSHILTSSLRVAVYKLCGLKFGKAVFLKPNILMNGTDISIGEGTFVNYSCIFENQEKIEIGENCSLGMEVLLCSATHELGNEDKRMGKTIGYSIIIEDGCWIGSRVTILPGVKVGKGCVIGAGSLVTKDCEPNGLYVGSPAKRVKELNENDLKIVSL